MTRHFSIRRNEGILRFLLKKLSHHVDAVFFAFFVTFSVLLLLGDLKNNKVAVKVRHVIQFGFSDFAKSFIWITDSINKAVIYWDHGSSVHYKNFLVDSYLENSDFKRIINENKRLKELLKYLVTTNLKSRNYVTARIISNIGSTYGFIQLGKKDGVKNNQMVLNESGLIGKVVDVAESQAKIIFVTDSNCRVLSRTAETGHKIIVSGKNEGYLDILYLPDGAKLKTGEVVVTTPDFNFPADIKVGIVNSDGKVQPIVDLSHIDFVTVIIH